MRPRSSSNSCRDLGVKLGIALQGLELAPHRRACRALAVSRDQLRGQASTASVVKMRPGREDADFFMRAFDDTGGANNTV